MLQVTAGSAISYPCVHLNFNSETTGHFYEKTLVYSEKLLNNCSGYFKHEECLLFTHGLSQLLSVI